MIIQSLNSGFIIYDTIDFIFHFYFTREHFHESAKYPV